MTEENKNKVSLRSLFNNNKFVLVFSLLASFCLWLWISIEKSPVVENTVLSVPVQINLEDSIPAQLGLKVFGNENYTVDVTVVGKKFVVGSLSADDIRVTAQTSYVNSAGTKTLLLKATPVNGKDFEITALSQNYISVFFDSLKEVEFAIEPKIISKTDQVVSDDLVLGEAVFSNGTILVSGPATEVNRITGVIAEYVIEETLTKTTTVTPVIKFAGAEASELTNTKVANNSSVITMTIPVLKEVILPTAVSLRNVPADYIENSFHNTVTPSSVKVAVQLEKLDQVKEIIVGTVDFNQLDLGTNTFNFSSKDITDYVLLDDNIEFECNILIEDIESKIIDVPAGNIKIENVKSGYNVKMVDSDITDVKILGPSAVLNTLTNENINAVIDFTDINIVEGNMTVPVAISVNDNTSCWAHGEYKVTVYCEKNNQ